MGQSYNYFGFTIAHEGMECWFGYSLPTWKTHDAPVCLQIREKWIKTRGKEIVESLKGIGFRADDKLEWVLPFPITEIDRWDSKLSDVLLRFASSMTAAPIHKE